MASTIAFLASSWPQLLFTLFIIYVISAIAAWWRLREFKGPWLGKFSYLWMASAELSNEMNNYYMAASKKYGKLTRVGPNDLVSSDAEIVRHINGVRSGYTKSNYYDVMKIDPYVHNTFSETSPEVHTTNRAYMANGYSGKENPHLEDELDEVLKLFVGMIEEKYISTKDVLKVTDFSDLTSWYTLDSLTRIAYGRSFGWMKEGKDLFDYMKLTLEILPIMVFSGAVPIAGSLYLLLGRIAGPSPKDKKGIGRLLGLARDVVEERFQGDIGENQDMLDSWIRHGFTDRRRIAAEILFQIVAGGDTVSGALRATFLHVLSSARVMRKLTAEIDEAVKAGRVSDPISNEQTLKLPYLQAVMKEGLRIHPPSSGLLFKKVPKGGDVLDGRYVPEGTRVGHSMWAIQRDTKVYGPDTDVYRPERWTDADAETYANMEKQVDLVFGYGRWGCMGKPVAFMTLQKTLFELFRRYDFELLNPSRPYVEFCHIIFVHTNMKIRITRRSDSD
ncbi:cytochrome P450 [Rhizodiscina lignyota]|uniref:Cytochrome P450 n=1 Tax=Rhizodiscina lignyota TaxID=1504668 RepID=A0A9P4IFW0_9PEZI|nr:cytochrome P450 [Rhizodiscina lignyota]